MHIKLASISQKFNTHYLFKDLSLNFFSTYKYAITGDNGSGKSTLIKIIASLITPTYGKISYFLNNNTELTKESLTKYVSMLAPYIEPDNNLSLFEQLSLYKSFRSTYNSYSIENILETIKLEKYKNHSIYKLSSGMRQRLKLGLAFCFKSEIILLDEPTSYLDKNGLALYNYFIENYTKNKILIIASNQKHETHFCDKFINL